MAKERIIGNLKQSRIYANVAGITKGCKNDKFYEMKKSQNTGNTYNSMLLGVTYDDDATIWMNSMGFKKKSVFFNKYDKETKKSDTKEIPWDNYKTYKEDGYSLIGGITCGLEKKTDENGKTSNVVKKLAEFDALPYIHEHLSDDMSVFCKAAVEFSTYINKDGDTVTSRKLNINQVSRLKEDIVDDEGKFNYDGIEKSPINDWKGKFCFESIEKDDETKRFIVNGFFIGYEDVARVSFFIDDAKLANLIKKNVKPYTEISCDGKINVIHDVEEVEEVDEEDVWGDSTAKSSFDNKRVNSPSHTEFVIVHCYPKEFDKEAYTEDSIMNAIKKVRASKTADKNFNSGVAVDADNDDDWGSDDSDDLPWD